MAQIRSSSHVRPRPLHVVAQEAPIAPHTQSLIGVAACASLKAVAKRTKRIAYTS